MRNLAEPDTLVLKLLREIRASQDEMRSKLGQYDQPFSALEQSIEQLRQGMNAGFEGVDERFDERFDEMTDVVRHTFGLAGANDITLRQYRAQLREIERRVGRLEAQRS